jgi:hypothetical protein
MLLLTFHCVCASLYGDPSQDSGHIARRATTLCIPQGWPGAARHVLVSLEAVQIVDPERLSSQNVNAVVVAYRLLPELCPAQVQQTEALPLSTGPTLSCSHAMVNRLLCVLVTRSWRVCV